MKGFNFLCDRGTMKFAWQPLLSYSFMNQHSCVRVNGATQLKEQTKIYLNFSTATVYSANPILSWVTIILEAPISASPLVSCWRSRNSLEFLNWPLDSTTCNLYGFTLAEELICGKQLGLRNVKCIHLFFAYLIIWVLSEALTL